MTMLRRVLLVGEMPHETSDPTLPLFPVPEHRTGGRLAKMMGLRRSEYLIRTRRINLINEPKWSTKTAREHAKLIKMIIPDYACAVFLGKRVINAFGCGDLEIAALLKARFARGEPGVVLCLPHPSGKNLWYNDERNAEKAEAALHLALAMQEKGYVPSVISG